MGISYPQGVGITFGCIHQLANVWKTYPLLLCITHRQLFALWTVWKTCPQALWKSEEPVEVRKSYWSGYPDAREIPSVSIDSSKTGSKFWNALLHISARLSTILPDLSTLWAGDSIFSTYNPWIISYLKNLKHFQTLWIMWKSYPQPLWINEKVIPRAYMMWKTRPQVLWKSARSLDSSVDDVENSSTAFVDKWLFDRLLCGKCGKAVHWLCG